MRDVFLRFFPTSCRDFFINNIPKMNNWGEFFQKVFFNFRFWTKKKCPNLNIAKKFLRKTRQNGLRA